ncbi:MAG: kelch repeat-containing protein [Burkholderiales bacterium]
MLRRCLAVTALLAGASAAAGDRAPAPPSRTPGTFFVTGPRVELDSGESLFVVGAHAIRFRASDGRVTDSALPLAFDEQAMEDTRHGLVLAGGVETRAGVTAPSDRVALLRPRGRVLAARLSEARANPVSARLADDAVLVVGGRRAMDMPLAPASTSRRSSAADLIEVRGDRLVVTRLPDLPGPPRHGFPVIALDDGGALVVGGEPGDFDACHACVADAWRLDRSTKSWRSAGAMTVGRAAPVAARLPGGEVLVAGGWSTGRQDAAGSAELYDPRTGRWSVYPSMPSPLAHARAHWLAGSAGRTLIVGGGTNPQIHALDVATREWRTLAEMRAYRIRAHIVSYLDGRGQPWIAAFGGVHAPRGRSPGWDGSLERAPLRLPGIALDAGAPYRLSRAAPALAVRSDGAVTLVGGAVDGDPGSVATAAVDELRGSPPVLTAQPAAALPRAGAFAAWLDDATLVVAAGHPAGHDEAAASPLPVEVFDTRDRRWRDVTHVTGKVLAFDPDAGLAATPDGALVAIQGTSALRLRIADAVATALPLTPLPRARRRSIVRAFEDGRIVVAGGEVQTERIVTVDAGRAADGSADVHEGFGPFLPARRHALYDPATKAWQESAPATSGESAAAILHDSRVVRVGVRPLGPVTEASPGEFAWVCEISTADGSRWRALPVPGFTPRPGGLRLAVQRGELLLEAPRDDKLALLRFDFARGQWLELAAWAPSNRDMGRLMIADLPDKRIVWVWP